MNRQQAKELLPIIQAFAKGKTIQVKARDDIWYNDENELKFDSDPQNYRIKPEPKYRPFRDDRECWEEMEKHKPFGWIKYQRSKSIFTKTLIIEVLSSRVKTIRDAYSFEQAKKGFTFADGTPFGIRIKDE